MARSKTGYRARKLISVSEGAQYGPGDLIEGPFDPKDEHNARLIEDESIQVMEPGGESKPAPEPDEDGDE